MRKILLTCFIILLPSVILVSCSSSKAITNKDNTGKKTNKKVTTKKIKETFVITPYRTKIDVKPNTKNNNSYQLNIWYGYEKKQITDTLDNTNEMVNGYRVQILSTDKLTTAKGIKERLLPRINQDNVYILFDPPFYKVQVGDFTVHSLAEDLNFKLKQLGYRYSRVVREKVKKF